MSRDISVSSDVFYFIFDVETSHGNRRSLFTNLLVQIWGVTHFVRCHLLQGSLQLHSFTSHDQLMNLFTKSHPPGRFAILCLTSRWSLALHLEFEGGCWIVLCVHMYLVPHGLMVCISGLLAYIYRPLMYNIMCDYTTLFSYAIIQSYSQRQKSSTSYKITVLWVFQDLINSV
jgi:hypothetical protein